MMTKLSEDNLNRLVKLIMLKFGVSPSEAYRILEGYKLTLICGHRITQSVALQAALLTAVNCGKRSFLGGVEVIMPDNVPLLVPWPGHGTLNSVVRELGGAFIDKKSSGSSFTLLFGVENDFGRSLHINCNGWVGGVSESVLSNPPIALPDFALGGIAAGALGVAGAFFRVTKLREFFGCSPTGISLWRPDIHWLLPEANGCELKILPSQLWVLGLGHLGQAFLWSLGLLLGPINENIEIILQDFDIVKEANYSTGLLSEMKFIDGKKTRVCAQWLEQRDVKTRIIEQRFNAATRRDTEDPRVAVCGFDNAEPRRYLENVGFSFIVEAGLGAAIDDFDNLLIHTFPNKSIKANSLWSEDAVSGEVDSKLKEAFMKDIGEINGCGILASTLAGKAISTAFVGAFTGTLVLAEILRGLHDGPRCGSLNVQLRSLGDIGIDLLPSSQGLLALNRFTLLKKRSGSLPTFGD